MNVVTVGVLREDELIHSYVPKEAAKVGYDIILVGKPTDRSGFGGASFASGELKEEDAEANKGAVQEPNPFLERHILAATYDIFKELKKRKQLHKVSCKDLGAGGVVCASVEQVAHSEYGAKIQLEKLHVADAKLPPHVLACSETQERFCWMVHPTLTKLVLDTYNKVWDLPGVSAGAEGRVIGKVTTGNYVMTYHGETLVDAPATFLTEGLQYNRPYAAKEMALAEAKIDYKKLEVMEVVKRLLGQMNISSRACITERYDKQVQGLTVADGDTGNSAVFRPLLHTSASKELQKIGATIGCGGDGRLGGISARTQAEHAVCEAVANVASLGARPLALTDCLNYGNPERPEQMAQLVEGIEGLATAAEAFGLPYISGNVSLYNAAGDKPVNPSAIVACVGKLEDASKSIPNVLQRVNSTLCYIGTRSPYLGGSEFLHMLGADMTKTYDIDSKKFAAETRALLRMIDAGVVRSARDIHRGGLAITALEMTFGTPFGLYLRSKVPATEAACWSMLFAENPGYLIEIHEDDIREILGICVAEDVVCQPFGTPYPDPIFAVSTGPQEMAVRSIVPLAELEGVWRNSLREWWVG